MHDLRCKVDGSATDNIAFVLEHVSTGHCLHTPQGQVAPLDLSGVDLSAASGDRLKRDRRWTFILMIKLSIPLFVAIVRVFVNNTRDIDRPTLRVVVTLVPHHWPHCVS